MRVTPSIDFPGTYYIVPHTSKSSFAEFCEDGDIKIQIWHNNSDNIPTEEDNIPTEELELLYTKVRYNVWMPLFNNGRLL